MKRIWQCVALTASLTGMVGLNPAWADDGGNVQPAGLTYSKDIAPIFNSKCVQCHRPGEMGPMSLTTYEETRPWVKSIRKSVDEGTMPPWHADPQFGKFANDRRLADDEKTKILAWASAGAPQGNPADAPPTPKFVEGWQLGEPDMVVTLPEYKLPGGGPDLFPDLEVKLDIPEDRWVTAVEVRPGNRKVVHHVIAFLKSGGGNGGANGWLGAWAAGMDPMTFPKDMGRVIPKGATLIGNMHYHPAESASSDQTRIGVHFAKKEMQKEVINLWVQNASFKIPAGADNHEVKSSFTFDQDSQILGFLPHMHYRGKDFTYTAKFPDGRSETLLRVPKYDFNWQTVYYPAQAIQAPKGTKIECVAHFDNSANNPANPDPKRDVTFGNETKDEMMIGFVDYIVNEGVRPISAEFKLAGILRDLVEKHPSDTFDVTLIDDEDNGVKHDPVEIKTVLRFPAEGDGDWFIPVQGRVYEGKLKEIKHYGATGYTGKIMFPGLGTFTIRGALDRKDGTLLGKVYGPKNKEMFAFKGSQAKVNKGL